MEPSLLHRLATSTIPYKIALVIAVFLLLLIAGINYKQVKGLQSSADWVSHSLRVDKEINNLFSQFNLMESAEFRSVILGDTAFADSYIDYKLESDKALKNLYQLTKGIPEHQVNLDSVSYLKDSLHTTLTALHGKIRPQDTDSTVMAHVQRAADLLKNLRAIKAKMLLKKESLLQERLAAYKRHTFITPFSSLLLALFSLGVFVIAFAKIRGHKNRIQASEALLQNIVQSTDNIMNYYEPIYDRKEKLVDFKIIFANECNRDYFGLDPEKIVGKPISKIFPFLQLNGELEEMIAGFKKGETVEFERQIAVNGEKFWFHSVIKPMDKGILVVARNKTGEYKAHEKVMEINDQLKDQNDALKKTELFLESILGSTDNIIMSFEPVTDDQGHIVDFTYLFINDQIRHITGVSPDNLIGERVSEVNPSIFKSGVFEKMVESFIEDRKVEYETRYEHDGGASWFHGTAMRSGNTVTITANNISKEKNALKKLEKLNQQLEIQNSIMLEAKKMAKIGSYVWYIETDTAEISDNYYRILEYEPHEFRPSLETYRQLVHPSDSKEYEKIMKWVVETKNPPDHTYRIITKTGKTKYLKTKGKFTKKNGQEILVGVVQDVTDLIRTEIDLRIKNTQLKRSNTELESFNRVASHDLQEPLRKIQMFISRLEETEHDKLSEKGKGYFDKINDAAARMQSLIRNLLAYSRIDSTHENFEKVDLNLVLDKVREDLVEEINEAGAKISTEKLPKVQGVFFQMEQLFTNLIANALKYRNPELVPKIVLKSEKVHNKELPEDFIKSFLHYYRITVADNGIGFANENAEKIFEVFQRLHQKTEYSGTGIGLAICKKIVENHHGFIHATGERGKGAAFIVYLPVHSS